MGTVSQGSLSRAPTPDREGPFSCNRAAVLPLQPPHTVFCVWLQDTPLSNEMATCEAPRGDPCSCQACQLRWNVLSSWGWWVMISESVVIFSQGPQRVHPGLRGQARALISPCDLYVFGGMLILDDYLYKIRLFPSSFIQPFIYVINSYWTTTIIHAPH